MLKEKSKAELVKEYKAYVVNYCILNGIKHNVVEYYDYDYKANVEVILVDDDCYQKIQDDLEILYPMFDMFCISPMSFGEIYGNVKNIL